MITTWRYLILVLVSILGIHFILTVSHEAYGNATSISRLLGAEKSRKIQDVIPDQYHWPDNTTFVPNRRANASIVMLARNGDLSGVVKSVKQMEDRFNKRFHYPYTFLNEEPFTDEFKERVTELTDATVEFGLIPPHHWHQPDWVDEQKASAAREDMEKNNVIYGGSLPYRNMCRFNSGFFFRHELLAKYKYYWRVEPDVTFFCDLDFDPFLFMQDNEKVYGFTITLPEYGETIETLWQTVRDFMEQNPDLIASNNGMGFLSDDNGLTYNRCHFWSNFEIADLDFWRGEAYMKFFEHLDSAGGFYYERWGDAPVHSIGAALLVPKEKLHFFREVGYRHEPFQHCPMDDLHRRGKCWCDEKQDNFDYHWYSCMPKYDRIFE
ncbi:glycosyltransferase family 15 protein [Russula ochroleuca]|jgi:alpha 1,2-mannosyltransferase|uniref:Glycosyltransferase family 15 protein n=1 Tax=Russula ochroleuca TaxID=152965 RepID=A0A9P5T7D2_9AGAM|nr:glycosyltransferase family 15 protein [Russula ochroleuca]